MAQRRNTAESMFGAAYGKWVKKPILPNVSGYVPAGSERSPPSMGPIIMPMLKVIGSSKKALDWYLSYWVNMMEAQHEICCPWTRGQKTLGKEDNLLLLLDNFTDPTRKRRHVSTAPASWHKTNNDRSSGPVLFYSHGSQNAYIPIRDSTQRPEQEGLPERCGETKADT